MRILACAHLDGELDRLQDLRLVVEEERPDLVVFAGGLLAPGREGSTVARGLHRLLHGLAALPCAVAVVPGAADAPERRVLPVATAQEWTERNLHCVHGMLATIDDLAVAGFGGDITERERETEVALRYPAWELRYRMAFLNRVEQPLLLVHHHPPAQMHELDVVDGRHIGSQAVTEVVGTWRPRVVVVAGPRPAREMYASTVVVSPGRLDQGSYALFDAFHDRKVQFHTAGSAI
jgi:Icc-related predicted phosphoesterase